MGNLVPMHPTLNLSTFKVFENKLAGTFLPHYKAGRGVLLFMSAKPNYPSDDAAKPASYRPTSISVQGKIITLKPATPLATNEVGYQDNFSNPESSPGVILINQADSTELRALALHPRLVDAILTERAKGRFSTMDGLEHRLGLALGDYAGLVSQLTNSAITPLISFKLSNNK